MSYGAGPPLAGDLDPRIAVVILTRYITRLRHDPDAGAYPRAEVDAWIADAEARIAALTTRRGREVLDA